MDPKNAPQPPNARQLPIELGEDVAEGLYSNLMFCTHSPSEFILDFARVLPGARKGKVYARVVMTPQHAKALSQLLQRNVAAFEEEHGAIATGGEAETKIGFSPSSTAGPNGPTPTPEPKSR